MTHPTCLNRSLHTSNLYDMNKLCRHNGVVCITDFLFVLSWEKESVKLKRQSERKINLSVRLFCRSKELETYGEEANFNNTWQQHHAVTVVLLKKHLNSLIIWTYISELYIITIGQLFIFLVAPPNASFYYNVLYFL